jgi:hypothetical protein
MPKHGQFLVCFWISIFGHSVLVFDGFYNYHFEPRQNMSNSLFVFGFQFFQCPKKLVMHRAEKVTPLALNTEH